MLKQERESEFDAARQDPPVDGGGQRDVRPLALTQEVQRIGGRAGIESGFHQLQLQLFKCGGDVHRALERIITTCETRTDLQTLLYHLTERVLPGCV